MVELVTSLHYNTRRMSVFSAISQLSRGGHRWNGRGWGRRETRDSWSLHLLVDLGQDLRVPEQGVLLIADLDGAATELYRNLLASYAN
jgi:hypothetical protein